MSAKSSENYKVCPLEGCSAKYNIPSSYERHLVQKHQKPKRFLAEHPFDGQPNWVAPAEPPVPTLTQQELDRVDCACPVDGCGVEFKHLSTRLTHLKRTHKMSGKKAADAIKQLEGKEVGEEGNEPEEEGDLDGEGEEKEEGKEQREEIELGLEHQDGEGGDFQAVHFLLQEGPAGEASDREDGSEDDEEGDAVLFLPLPEELNVAAHDSKGQLRRPGGTCNVRDMETGERCGSENLRWDTLMNHLKTRHGIHSDDARLPQFGKPRRKKALQNEEEDEDAFYLNESQEPEVVVQEAQPDEPQPEGQDGDEAAQQPHKNEEERNELPLAEGDAALKQ